MTDGQFVTRVAHAIISEKLEQWEQLALIKLSYRRMAFPKVEAPQLYYDLMVKLYGRDRVELFLNEKLQECESAIMEHINNDK